MLTMGQATVPSSSTVQALIIPAGTVGTIWFQPTPASTPVFVGTSPNVTPTNGLQIPVTPTWTEGFITSKATPIYATTGNTIASSFQYLISTGE